MDRYEITNKNPVEITAIQLALEEHFKDIKKLDRSLPCFPDANDNICILVY
jgi:hypothetical protein